MLQMIVNVLNLKYENIYINIVLIKYLNIKKIRISYTNKL